MGKGKINAISSGNGMATFFKINSKFLKTTGEVVQKDEDDNIKENENGDPIKKIEEIGTEDYLYFKAGHVVDIAYKTTRDAAPNHIAGITSSIGINKGKRLVSGRITFSTFEEDIIKVIEEEMIKADSETGNENEFINSDVFGGDLIEAAGTLDAAKTAKKMDLDYLDQLPPIDIIVMAKADENTDGAFELGNVYKLELKSVKFSSESFGVASTALESDKVADCIIARGISDWQKA